MGATENQGALAKRDTLLRKLEQTRRRILAGDRAGYDGVLSMALQAYCDSVGFEVKTYRPRTFGELLQMDLPTPALLRQLHSELRDFALLQQIEEQCFLNPANIAIAAPLVEELWRKQVTPEADKPPQGFSYLPPERAVTAYKKIFGSSLRAETTLRLATQAVARKDSEGIAIWPKLSTIFRLFGNRTHLVGYTPYSSALAAFIEEVGKFLPDSLVPNKSELWQLRGIMGGKQPTLTNAGATTWERLEEITDDDFCFSPAGATTGQTYAGHANGLSRLKMVLAGNQFPQDAVMVFSTILIQPERFNKLGVLNIDCPATAIPRRDFYSQDSYQTPIVWGFEKQRIGPEVPHLKFDSPMGSFQPLTTPDKHIGAACGFFS